MKVNVSVVIPTFRRVHLLQQCLKALLQQNFRGTYEVIVVSDGKDEATAALVQEFSQQNNTRFVFTSLSRKSGPAAARNKGWQTANGELILFTDDDTQPSSNWLQAYWNAYLFSPKKEIAFTGKTIVPIPPKPTDYERNTAGLETADFITANCACTKLALQTIHGFDEEFTMAWREDSELHFKLLNAQIPIVKVEDAIVLHPVRKAAWGVSLKEQKKSMFNALLFKKHPSLFRTKIMETPVWNYYAMIVLFVAGLVLLIFHFYKLSLLFLSGWLLLEIVFISKRLRNNSLSFSHLCEMLVTSFCIPFLSVFWTLYGAYKFKVFFL